MHDHDPVSHRHGLDLVVGHVDGGRLEALVQFLDLGAHLHAQLGVEIGERLVEEENLRVAHDRTAHRHALALAAGELPGIAVEHLARPRMSAAGFTLCDLGRGTPFISREKPMFSATVMCG
jgi:hypothetical protein